MNSLLLGIHVPELNYSDVAGALGVTSAMATGLAMGLGILQVAISYLKSSLGGIDGNGGQIIDLQAIARFILILSALGMYQPLAEGILAGGKQYESSINSKKDEDLIAKAAVYFIKNGEQAEQNLTPGPKQVANSDLPQEEKNVIISAYDNISQSMSDLGTSIMNFIENFEYQCKKFVLVVVFALTKLIAVIIREVSWTLNVMMGRVLLAVGPITIAMTMIPSMTGVFQKWLGSLLTISFSLGTFALMDLLMESMFLDGMEAASNHDLPVADMLSYIGQNLSIIFMFASASKITGMAFGSGDSGGIAGQTVQGVSSAVQGAAGLAKMALGMATSSKAPIAPTSQAPTTEPKSKS